MILYKDKIEKEKRVYYSLNFLIAEFTEIKNAEQDASAMNERIDCPYFVTSNFKTREYYKPVFFPDKKLIKW